MTKENGDDSENMDILVRWRINEDKKLYDRANFFIAAQSFIFGGFATLVANNGNLTSYFRLVPTIICVAGIFLNILWGVTSKFQTEESIIPLDKKISAMRESLAFLSNFEKSSNISTKRFSINLFDLIHRAAPLILGVTWGVLFVFSVLQIT